jgi:hypothetical protein
MLLDGRLFDGEAGRIFAPPPEELPCGSRRSCKIDRRVEPYSAGSLAMSFPDDKDQDFAVLLLRDEFVSGLAAPVREIDRGGRIRRQNPQGLARLHGGKPLTRFQHRQRAQQAPYIDFRLVVYQARFSLTGGRFSS